MRTRFARLDLNKDGYISREDFEIMSEKLVAETKGMTKEQVDATYRGIMNVADAFGLKKGVKKTVEEAAKSANNLILSMTPEEKKAILRSSHDPLFDAIDTNKDGHISLEEFKVYFHVVAPDITEAEIIHSFNTIDANKDGKISREEFMAAAEDFLQGVEETEISRAYFGHLL